MRLVRPTMIFIGVFCGVIVASSTSRSVEPTILASQVRSIFEAKCASCHGEHLAEPEGMFDFVRDLKRIAEDPKLVVPGDLRRSELFRLLNDLEMPPADSDIQPLHSGELRVLREWIERGAPSNLPSDWLKIAENHPIARPKPNDEPSTIASAKNPIKADQTIKIELLRQPAKEIFAKLSRESGITIRYTQPAKEPVLSLRSKSSTLKEILDYLVLNGNLTLTWKDDVAIIRPNAK